MTYLYTIATYGYPPSISCDFKALNDIEAMGFHYIEMEGLGQTHTQQVWQHRNDLKKALRDCGIHVHNFCAVDPDLVSLDDAKRRSAYDRFRYTAELGAYLGADTLHLASYAPPVIYRQTKPYQLDKEYDIPSQVEISLPDGFSWQRVWEVLIESCRTVALIATEFERNVLMEPRIGELICSVDSMLRLLEQVNAPNLYANFDTGHFSAQRENVILALAKLEGRYGNIHVSDNDPRTTDHLPLGEGTINWREFLGVLKRQDYDGYLGLDLTSRATLKQDLQKSAQFLQEIAAEQGIVMQR